MSHPTPDRVAESGRSYSSAYDMHANWRERDPREILDRCRRNHGRITPYARDRGFRSYVVCWNAEGCEGHLYIIRVRYVRETCERTRVAA